jgi:hypothetical protein
MYRKKNNSITNNSFFPYKFEFSQYSIMHYMI